MNLIVFLIRVFAGVLFIGMVGVSIDPAMSENNPHWHTNYVATAAALLLTAIYFRPLLAEVKSGKIIARMPTARSFTATRFLSSGRWWLAYIMAIITGDYFLESQFSCGILSLLAVVCLMPPVDRLLFAPTGEMAVRLKGNPIFFKFFPNLGAFAACLAMGFFAQKSYTITTYILLASISLSLVVPIVLFVKGGWKALSLTPALPPVMAPNQSFEIPAGRSDAEPISHIPHASAPVLSRNTADFPPTRNKRKYYSAKAWPWNWPLAKEVQRYPLNEQGFNQLIKGFEVSWLQSKDYHRRLALHRDPPAFLKEVIVEAESYIASMHLRPQLMVRNRPMSTGSEPVRFVPDEVGKVWLADRRLRSLYQAVQRFTQTPAKRAIMSLHSIAPHIAEYRAMSNLVRHLGHSLSRMSGQELKKIADPIINPMQTEDKIPAVFISYSWDSPEHEDWVINLATRLCENGVDAILDKWDLGLLGKLLPHFMETSIARSHRVICIMTPNYKKKTESLAGGVGYEYSIITAEIFTDNINTTKFIPLFRRGTDADAIPIALRGRKYVDMRDDSQFDEKFIHELLRDIHDEPKFRKPAIGKKTQF